MSFQKIMNKNEMINFINKNQKAVVMIGASFCGPCRRFGPIFEKVGNESSLAFGKAEIDISRDINEVVSAGSVPTVIFYLNGKEIHREIGGMGEEDLKNITASKLG